MELLLSLKGPGLPAGRGGAESLVWEFSPFDYQLLPFVINEKPKQNETCSGTSGLLPVPASGSGCLSRHVGTAVGPVGL